MSKVKEIKSLKPIEPSQLWTFENAQSLLTSCKDKYILQGLDEYLLNNRSVIMSALPFKSGTKNPEKKSANDRDPKPEEAAHLKDLLLRNVLYLNLTASNNTDAKEISGILGVDFKEALRTISQVCQRNPERKVFDIGKTLKSKLPDDSAKNLHNERILLYVTRLLRDRRIVLNTAMELINNKFNTSKSSVIQNLGKELVLSRSYIEGVLSEIVSLTDLLIAGNYKLSGSNAPLDTVLFNETVLTITELLKVAIGLIQLSTTQKTTHLSIYTKWFAFMKKTNFMLTLGPHIPHHEPFQLIQGLATLVTVTLLEVDDNYGDKSYMTDEKIFALVNDSIVAAASSNPIVMYTWSIILYRITAIEEKTSKGKSYIKTINSLNKLCGDVFQNIEQLNNIVRFDSLYSAILSNVLILSIPFTKMNDLVASTIQAVLECCPSLVIESFYSNESVVKAFVVARAKFPVQITPYLMLSSISGNFAINEIRNLKSYMSSFKKAAFDQISQIDDENTELVKLTKEVDIFPPFELNKKLALNLATATKAKILPASIEDEVLVTFLYTYNGWAFLGRILQNIVRSTFVLAEDLESKSEFVVHLTKLLTKVVNDNMATDTQAILQVLDSLSVYIDDSDVIEILFRLFEQNLHSRKTKLLIGLLDLFTALAPLIGVKIWSYISKSALLSTNTNKEGFASTIFGSIEMVDGDYDFSISLIKLANELVKDCLSETGLATQFESQKSLMASEKVALATSKKHLLSTFINHLISVFESFPHCRFNKAYQKMEIGYLLTHLFQTILTNIYTIDDNNQPAGKVTSIFSEASEMILNSFLTVDQPSRSTYPILAMIDALLDHQFFNLYESRDLSGQWFLKWVTLSFSFSQFIISIRSQILPTAYTQFEKEIFLKLPLLVEIYTLHQGLRKDILNLLTSLTTAAVSEVTDNRNPPSLLSHLSRDHSQMLLRSLICDLKNTFDDYEMKVSLYDFICAVLSGNQEGLSMLFISGRDVYGEIGSPSKHKPKESILTVLKKNLQDMKYYPKNVALHLVDSLALAFNSWTTIRGNDTDLEFVDLLLSMFNQPQDIKAYTTDEYISRCYELKMLSKITEILSLIIYTTKSEVLNKKFINFFVKNEEFKFEFLKRFDTLGYNQHMHEELDNSFKQHLHVDLKLFSTSSLVKRNRFGYSAIYNLELMDKVFTDVSDGWSALREHVIACNVNIQYLNAQISVVKSHGALLTAFCKRFGNSLNSDWVFLASQLLFFNVLVKIPSGMFQQVYRERIELSFFILYTMHTNAATLSHPPLAENVLDVIKFSTELIALKNDDSEADSGNYKSLLRILKLALGMINKKSNNNILTSNISSFSTLFDLIITRGAAKLLIALQNEAYLIRTDKKYVPKGLDEMYERLSIILSIISEFVSISQTVITSSFLQEEMTKIVINLGTLVSTLNLFSNLHLIKTVDSHEQEQFLFSQLSLMLIYELLNITPIAQEFVNSGLFMVLTNSAIAKPIQKGGVSITDKSLAKYHTIWCNGLLPLVLSLFKILEPQVLPEICMFLRSFQQQIKSCIARWFEDLSSIEITTAYISETRQILYFYQMLRYCNVSEFLSGLGIQPSHTDDEEVVDMLLLPGLESRGKVNDFINKLNNLLKHPKFVASKILPSSPEEKRILVGVDSSSFATEVIADIGDLKDLLGEQD